MGWVKSTTGTPWRRSHSTKDCSGFATASSTSASASSQITPTRHERGARPESFQLTGTRPSGDHAVSGVLSTSMARAKSWALRAIGPAAEMSVSANARGTRVWPSKVTVPHVGLCPHTPQ